VQAGAREYPFEADVIEFAREEIEQGALLRAARREIAMATLAGDREVAAGRCDQRRLAQAGAGRDYCDVGGAVPILAPLQYGDFGFLQIRQAVGGHFEIVHQMRGDAADRALKRIPGHVPGDVGGVADAIDHRTGHAEACRADTVIGGEKSCAGLLETCERGGVIHAIADRHQLRSRRPEQSEMGLGAPDIAGQNHVRDPALVREVLSPPLYLTAHLG
jgi:hypothetical protein